MQAMIRQFLSFVVVMVVVADDVYIADVGIAVTVIVAMILALARC